MIANIITDMKPQAAEDLTETEKETVDLGRTAG